MLRIRSRGRDVLLVGDSLVAGCLVEGLPQATSAQGELQIRVGGATALATMSFDDRTEVSLAGKIVASTTAFPGRGLQFRSSASQVAAELDADGNLSIPGPAIAPLPPTGLEATMGSSGEVLLTWIMGRGTSGLGARVYRDGASLADVAPGSTQYSDDTVEAEATYTYQVAAHSDATGEGPRSAAVETATLQGQGNIMAAIQVRIATYQIILEPPHIDDKAQTVVCKLQMSCDDGRTHFALFHEDTTEPASYVQSGGSIVLFFHLKMLSACIDVLRNEKPVYIFFYDARSCGLTCGQEPIGEGEVPA